MLARYRRLERLQVVVLAVTGATLSLEQRAELVAKLRLSRVRQQMLTRRTMEMHRASTSTTGVTPRVSRKAR